MIWPSEAIWEAVVPDLPGFTVEVLPQTDSTNSELMRRAKAGDQPPILLVAEHQTGGRGRMGRQWHSASAAVPGQPLGSLTFSFGLPFNPADWSGLSLAVGVSVADSLDPGRLLGKADGGTGLGLKWPNDLLWQQRKLAGVLIETALMGPQRYVVVGIGLNVLPVVAPDLQTPSAWLDELLPGLGAAGALQHIAAPLVQTLLAFESLGFAPFQARFQARDALLEQPVRLSDGTTGTALGVTETGVLKVHTAQGLQIVASAEVSVQRMPGPPLAVA
ncbi:MAG: biotin--[acetyl-CoA-carboxylase] ligase [Burkholderiales bacterium]